MSDARLGSTVPALPVADIAAAVDYYERWFGFTCPHRDEGFAVLLRDAARLHLWRAEDTGWRRRPDVARDPVRSGGESFLAGTASCRIETDDVDALYAEFSGTRVLHPADPGHVTTTDFGTREFATVDLDGNLLEFFRWEHPQPGVEVPDRRGRTGLDRAGRDLTRNPDVVVRDVEVTSVDAWHVLRRTTLDVRRRDGSWQTQQRETYDRGNGAAILLYDVARRTVLLSQQFRFPVYVNDHPDGMFVEVAAGLLDDDDPETAIRREASEELGVDVGELTHVFDVWMSPGSVTERLHCFAAPYTTASRTGEGGGLADEGEDVEVVEFDVDDARAAVADGRIADAKTIMLLQWALLDGPFSG